ncbi:ATP-binding cassette domain-containing protein [Jidongwangia harbinensis]|uniref:ATP-binding cassette domain-containing protein n=1 Tax=Jidongwangia harbinensis TaxID=2878561 RepID=UPI001CD93072|nr:ABC transporter ATP-binding protein [Jidongwangia harbinensis]MCA2211566.1 ABC transporter ATP-binding protein [Jidongwangia harbinensis]
MSRTEHIVEALGLVKRRGEFTLGPLDLRVPRGFVTGMVGANGSGKTTTLRTLLGLVRADAGSVAMPPMGAVGVAFDQPFVLPYWRVRDAAEVYAASRPGWDQDWFDRLCRRFRLRADERVKELSRGQGNKLMIALAMGNHPDLLILDEPTSGLDPAARADLVDLLREHMRREDASLLFSTHITGDLEHFADYLVFVDNGQVVYSGALDELVERFAYVKGAPEDLTAQNTPLIRGLRRGQASFDGIIRTADSAAFGPGVHLETPTVEQIVVHHERRNDEEH